MTDALDLSIYTIYESPSEYPGKWVVREWKASVGGLAAVRKPLAVADTLGEARRALPLGLVQLGRSIDDDPCIREVWL